MDIFIPAYFQYQIKLLITAIKRTLDTINNGHLDQTLQILNRDEFNNQNNAYCQF